MKLQEIIERVLVDGKETGAKAPIKKQKQIKQRRDLKRSKQGKRRNEDRIATCGGLPPTKKRGPEPENGVHHMPERRKWRRPTSLWSRTSSTSASVVQLGGSRSSKVRGALRTGGRLGREPQGSTGQFWTSAANLLCGDTSVRLSEAHV